VTWSWRSSQSGSPGCCGRRNDDERFGTCKEWSLTAYESLMNWCGAMDDPELFFRGTNIVDNAFDVASVGADQQTWV